MRALRSLWVIGLLGAVHPPGRKTDAGGTIDEIVQPWAVSIVDTPTPPMGPRRIDVDRWEDLLRAAELLGRPILRLHGGEGGPEGRLFYVADGPQSYVFGFTGGSLNVARSGAYAPQVSPIAPTVPLPAPEEERPEPTPTPAPEPLRPVFPVTRQPPSIPPVVPDAADALLGPDLPEKVGEGELPSATVVERRIREMIHELLADFRKLPPSSDRLELGTEHIQRAVDMLHLGRYGIAQIELNKAARLLREPSPS